MTTVAELMALISKPALLEVQLAALVQERDQLFVDLNEALIDRKRYSDDACYLSGANERLRHLLASIERKVDALILEAQQLHEREID